MSIRAFCRMRAVIRTEKGELEPFQRGQRPTDKAHLRELTLIV